MPVTKYIWDVVSDNLLMELDHSGNTSARYDHEPGLHGELISQRRNGHTYYYQYDGMGNVVSVTDENQNVVESATYSAFGEVVQKASSIVNPFSYKGALGYYTNPVTNELDVRARIYEPAIGRWLSTDPIGFVDGLNRYIYSTNSPTVYSDPSGLLKVQTRTLPHGSCNGTTQPVKFDFILEYKDGKGKVGAACLGYVVQKVTVKCFIKSCNCGPCEVPDDEKEYDTFEYWEAWEVKKGDTSVLDNAFIPTWSSRCGRYVQTGVVKFFCRNRQNVPDKTGDKTVGTGPLDAGNGWKPGEFGGKKNRECGTKTGNLPATNDPSKVSFWDKDPVEGPATRSMETKWNCCDDPKKVEISAGPPAP